MCFSPVVEIRMPRPPGAWVRTVSATATATATWGEVSEWVGGNRRRIRMSGATPARERLSTRALPGRSVPWKPHGRMRALERRTSSLVLVQDALPVGWAVGRHQRSRPATPSTASQRMGHPFPRPRPTTVSRVLGWHRTAISVRRRHSMRTSPLQGTCSCSSDRRNQRAVPVTSSASHRAGTTG